jgi:hypothetical protein
MGCTGRGTPKTAPVTRLKRPEVTRVAGRSMASWRARARVRGRKVPRSPRAPESSESGERRRVRRLWRRVEGRERRGEGMVVEGAGGWRGGVGRERGKGDVRERAVLRGLRK